MLNTQMFYHYAFSWVDWLLKIIPSICYDNTGDNKIGKHFYHMSTSKHYAGFRRSFWMTFSALKCDVKPMKAI